jgi:uncharacterized membrane protein (UPF0182 family)
MADLYIGERKRGGRLLYFVIAAAVLLLCSRFIASTLIDYAWWQEMHQLDTWFSLLLYGWGPAALAALLLFAAFFSAFRAGISHDRRTTPLFGFLDRRLLNRIALLVFALFALFIAHANVESWTVVRYFAGLRVPPTAGEYVDPIFHKPLTYYFFGLPFYNLLLQLVLVGTVLTLIIYWAARNLETLQDQLPRFPSAPGEPFRFQAISLRENFNGSFVRVAIAIFLIALAIKIFFDRYALLLTDHGQYLVGVGWIAEHVIIPLQWLLILSALAAAAAVLLKHGKLALLLLVVIPLRLFLPAVVESLYVRPNELALERPYIQRHIDATRSAYKLNSRVKENVEAAEPEIPIDINRHRAVLDNVRLWDWRAFHDTISQIQPLRPYVYMDTDVDRYDIDGQLRQVLIAPRELDTRQLGTAGARWINTHLMYTHGYGIVMAEANRITLDGLPLLFIKDAPPVVTTKSLRLTQPEIYYSEIAHEPVYVNTAQQEFNYPAGSESKYTNYAGAGGFPVASFFTRLAAAVYDSDPNVVLTSYLTAGSRMMVHRPVLNRLSALAGFLTWDADPYLVLTDSGRLVWIVDGYMSSNAHPYSRAVSIGGEDGISANYLRNSVKATVDAYSGETNLYIFDPDDVLIQAYQRLFPQLFKNSAAMPADLRRHARYPETLFSAQAEIYRTFHMRDPEAFYNRADLWDLAKTGTRGQEGASFVSPTYVVAALPGSSTAEFMLITTFTPANKDNLIGVMYARCDGEHLGELQFEQLAKQNIIYGPMQIDARINQDQNISKDLSLWNQQGSQVLRGQTLVLPIDNSFLYVEPIYIQASQASMPQLKKVALAMGNRLAYADTYEQALAQLTGQVEETRAPTAGANTAPPATPAQQAGSSAATTTLDQIRTHLTRYRDLSAQGKWSEAGKELDEIQRLLQK